MLCSLPFLVCLSSNSDYYRRQVSNRSTQAEARTSARSNMLSWEQMASFGVYQEGLDRSTVGRESLYCLVRVVQSRACAQNITGGGGNLSPVAAPSTYTTHSACSTSFEQQYGVVQCRSVCSSTVYSRSVECKNSYRLVRVHTSVEC